MEVRAEGFLQSSGSARSSLTLNAARLGLTVISSTMTGTLMPGRQGKVNRPSCR